MFAKFLRPAIILTLAGPLAACDDNATAQTADGGTEADTGMPPPNEVLDERAGLVLADEGFGDGASRLVYLDQGWNPAETLWFYHADQGSVLIPRRVLVNLEQPDSTTRFLDPAYMTRWRALPQRVTPDNPDGLPVGFARHDDRIGLTCAACHTNQLEYNGTAMRIDGAPALLDFDGMLEALEQAITRTLDDDARLARYLDAATPPGPPPVRDPAKAAAQAELEEAQAYFQSYNSANASTSHEGYGRLDAVGRIVNQVIRMTSGPENSVEPNAPNSYPFLWDAPRHDYVQWSGFGGNGDVGSLGRNAGEVVGVFGQVEVEAYTDPEDKTKGYVSTINMHNLAAMEAQLWNLQSPVWPEDILPPIDRALAERGAAIYQTECADCHALINRSDEDRRVRAQMYGLEQIGTDPTAARNFVDAHAPTGVLEGSVDSNGDVYGATAEAVSLLGTLVVRSISGQPAAAIEAKLYAMRYGLVEEEKQGDYTADSEAEPHASWLAYKARPLNGIWATAPYLHNGSVPTLYDLLLPVDQRPVTFGVGRRTFDPVKVGPVQTGEQPFTLDTRETGSSNGGHTQGTALSEADRMALVEYLKTL